MRSVCVSVVSAFRAGGLILALLAVSACTTVPKNVPPPDIPASDPVLDRIDDLPEAEPATDPVEAPFVSAPPIAPSEPPEDPVIEAPNAFETLEGWAGHDPRPALSAFRRSCDVLTKGAFDAPLNSNLPQYGAYGDWTQACEAADDVMTTADDARSFFESEFVPITLSSDTGEAGLLTGYYEPEVTVRVKPDDVFYEPILAWPKKKSNRRRVRAKINSKSARVIAYGRPIDVFFLQIQGSGRLRFSDGRVIRAAYAGNNGHPYRSIGRVLIERGEIKPEQSSKDDIERWMIENGSGAARELINENPRYIFFTEQKILPGEGPRGAMRVPLTGMASMAVDPRYHPYGALVWMSTTLPQEPGDYVGEMTHLLVSAQDTGSAIRGPFRGDLFFGSGFEAGEYAGVMKHPVLWTILVPKAIAPASSELS